MLKLLGTFFLLGCCAASFADDAPEQHKSTLDKKVEKLFNLTPTPTVEVQRPPVADTKSIPSGSGGGSSSSSSSSSSSAKGSDTKGAPALTKSELDSFKDKETNREVFATATVAKGNTNGIPEGTYPFTFQNPNEVTFLLDGAPKNVPANSLSLTDSSGNRVTPVTSANVDRVLRQPRTDRGPSISMGGSS